MILRLIVAVDDLSISQWLTIIHHYWLLVASSQECRLFGERGSLVGERAAAIAGPTSLEGQDSVHQENSRTINSDAEIRNQQL